MFNLSHNMGSSFPLSHRAVVTCRLNASEGAPPCCNHTTLQTLDSHSNGFQPFTILALLQMYHTLVLLHPFLHCYLHFYRTVVLNVCSLAKGNCHSLELMRMQTCRVNDCGRSLPSCFFTSPQGDFGAPSTLTTMGLEL